MPQPGRFLRENAFLVAAVLLPLVVAAFFMAATVIPRWLVAPPAYDLLLRAAGPYDQSRLGLAVDFVVREGRVEATVRALPDATMTQVPRLLLFDHQTLNVREIPVKLPASLSQADSPLTLVVSALEGRRVLPDAKAPDGYEFESRSQRGPGLIGDLFGMGGYAEKMSLVKNGRVVPISLPADQYAYGVSALGWVLHEGAR
jgi:hypothetical protein